MLQWKAGELLAIKPYDELTIQDNFLFQKVMRNKRICKLTLERLLDIEIKDISYPEEEKAIDVQDESNVPDYDEDLG